MDAVSGGYDNYHIVQLLIEYGADVNINSDAPNDPEVGPWHTPLQCAASRGHLGINVVKLLVKHGADLNTDQIFKRNITLHAAVSQGETAKEVVRYLLDNGANIKVPAVDLLGHAVKVAEEGTVVKLLLERGPVINNIASYIDSPDGNEWLDIERKLPYTRPLKVAAARGDSCKHLVQLLLNWGVDANAYETLNFYFCEYEFYKCKFHHCALDAALENGDDAKEVVKLLLNVGANFNIVDEGRAFSNFVEYVTTTEELEQLLLKAGPNEKHQFVKYDHIDVLSWVLYPTTKGKQVKEVVHLLRRAGIRLDLQGLLKTQPEDCRRAWLEKLDTATLMKLLKEVGLSDLLDDEYFSKGKSNSKVEPNSEEVKADSEEPVK